MKKLSSILLLLILIAFTFTACEKKHEPSPPQFGVTIDGKPTNLTSVEVIQGEPTTFAVVQADVMQKNSVQWLFNGTQVSTQQSYVLEAPETGAHLLRVILTNSDGDASQLDIALNVKGSFTQGTYVLSEGNFSTENGSLFFVSDKGKTTANAYFKANNTYLGNSAQDMFIAGDIAYIISQNGNKLGGDGRLVLADAATLKKRSAVNEELKSLNWPTNIAVIGTSVYIRDNNGVHIYETSTKTLTKIEGSDGAKQGRMAVAAGRVFVPAGEKLYAITNRTVQALPFTGVISGVIKADGDNIWVSCTSTPAKIAKIDAKTLEVTKTNFLEGFAIGAGWSGSPAISAINDTIYFSNGTQQINRHIFSSGKTEAVVDVTTLVPDANIVYGNLGVNPRTGIIFFTTIKDYSEYTTNNITLINARGAAPKLVENYKGYTRFPAGVFFTNNF